MATFNKPFRQLRGILERLPRANEDVGHVQIRILPGVFRNLELVKKADLSPNGFLDQEDEKKAGVQPGWMGAGGYPGLVSLLDSEARPSLNGPMIGPNVLQILAEKRTYKSSRTWEIPDELGRRFERLGVKAEEGAGTFWKDSICPKLLRRFRELTVGFPKIFVGPARSTPFARAIGVEDSAILTIPDYGAYLLNSELRSEVVSKIQGLNRPPLLIHSAGIAGSVLACNLSKMGIVLGVLDVGIAAAVTDIEYLASRAWFRENSGRILSSAHAITDFVTPTCSPGQKSHKKLRLKKSRDEARELSNWGRIRELSLEDPMSALKQLEVLLDGVNTIETPVLDSVLLVWQQFVAGSAESELLLKCAEAFSRPEPLLASTMVHDLRGEADLARSVLRRVREQFPRDWRLADWEKALEVRGNSTRKKEEWLSLAFKFGRPDLGSSLSWTLLGDLPSGLRAQ